MEKLVLTPYEQSPTSITLITPSETDSFNMSLLVSYDKENEVTQITPYTESESINSVAELLDILGDISYSEEASYNFTDRQLRHLKGYDFEELAPAIYLLANCCNYMKIKPIRAISVISALLKKNYSTACIVNTICSASTASIEDLVSSPNNILEVFGDM